MEQTIAGPQGKYTAIHGKRSPSDLRKPSFGQQKSCLQLRRGIICIRRGTLVALPASRFSHFGRFSAPGVVSQSAVHNDGQRGATRVSIVSSQTPQKSTTFGRHKAS
eukprot:gene10021-biopygen10792